MIRPTEVASIPNPSLIKFNAGAIIEPAITVKVAEKRIVDSVYLEYIFNIQLFIESFDFAFGVYTINFP